MWMVGIPVPIGKNLLPLVSSIGKSYGESGMGFLSGCSVTEDCGRCVSTLPYKSHGKKVLGENGL